MGAAFKQTQCLLRDELGTLRLSRYVNDIRTSALSLMSERKIKESLEKRNKREKDL